MQYMIDFVNGIDKMINIDVKLKKNYPRYSDRIDKMILVAKEIVISDDPFESMNKIVPTLCAMDAYVLGMIIGEVIMQKL